MSFVLSLFGIVHARHLPTFVSVEPAAICQLRCPECPVGQAGGISPANRQDRLMKYETWSKLLPQIAPFSHTIQFYFQGEPLLNPRLPKMIHEAHQLGMYTIVSTNAQALTPQWALLLVQAGLNRIIISLDGLSAESYNAYRVGGSLQQTLQAINNLRLQKASKHFPIIELQCLRLKTNEHEWTSLQRSFRQLGADWLVFKSAQFYNYQNGHPLMPSNPKYSRYIKKKDGLYHLRKQSSACLRLWTGCVVTTSGQVLPCCYDKQHLHSFGNIYSEPLKQLFHSAKANAFRQHVLQKQKPDICLNCIH